MADTTVTATANISTTFKRLFGPYWSDNDTAIVLYVNAASTNLVFARTTDAGETWAETDIGTGAIMQFACWYDLETPGISTTLVHCAYIDSAGGDNFFYRTVDVSDGSVGTQRTVDSTVTVSTTNNRSRCAITVTKSGNIITAWSTQSEVECYRSDDSGASWDSIADVFETGTEEDYVLLFPSTSSDEDDAYALFWDRSANSVTPKFWDNSAGTWTEGTGLLFGHQEHSVKFNIDAAVALSDGHLKVLTWSGPDSSNADLRAYDIDPVSASGAKDGRGNVVTNFGGAQECAVLMDQVSGNIYVAIINGTLGLSADVHFYVSTDDMVNWGSEQTYSEAAADNLDGVHCGRTVTALGGHFMPIFYNEDFDDIFVNLNNSISLNAPVTDGSYVFWM